MTKKFKAILQRNLQIMKNKNPNKDAKYIDCPWKFTHFLKLVKKETGRFSSKSKWHQLIKDFWELQANKHNIIKN